MLNGTLLLVWMILNDTKQYLKLDPQLSPKLTDCEKNGESILLNILQQRTKHSQQFTESSKKKKKMKSFEYYYFLRLRNFIASLIISIDDLALGMVS